jgi:UDP-2,3-diacylglucosamine pyrophosphatase LpxH
LNRLVEESRRRRVIWIRGNHDDRFPIPTNGNIQIEPDSYTLTNVLHIMHGDHFDFVMPNNRFFMKCFRAWHSWRIRSGAPSMHVSSYAKQYPRLYRFLTTRVKRRAVLFARLQGYSTITCGHTHFTEDTVLNGVRYLNTGSWTEDPPMCIRVDGSKVDLVEAAIAFA